MATIGNREETEDCGVRSLLSSRSSRDTTCLVSAKAFFANIARLDSFLCAQDCYETIEALEP